MLILPLIEANQKLFFLGINSHRNHLPMYCLLFFSEYNPLCGVSVRFKKPSSVFVVLYTIRVSLFVRRPPQMRGARARCHNTRKSAVVYRICRETDVCLYIPLASPCTSIISHSALLIPN